MANPTNYVALERLIGAEFARWYDERYAAVDGRMAGRLAEWLASQGVLVPSALSDEELLSWRCAGLGLHPMDTEGSAERAASIREDLERIARGE